MARYIFIMILWGQLSCAESVFEPGWFFYHEKKEDEALNQERTSLSGKGETLQNFKDQIQQVKSRALMDPTTKNVLELAQIRKLMMTKSHQFANEWQNVLRLHPELDTLSHIPQSFAAQSVARASHRERVEDSLLQVFAQNHFLFFYKANCELCRLMFTTFSKVPEMRIVPVCLEGPEIFPGSIKYENLGIELKTTLVPALAQVTNDRKKVKPIVTGAMDLESLMELIYELNR